MQQRVSDYFSILGELPLQAKVTNGRGEPLSLAAFYTTAGKLLDGLRDGGKLMFAGNGGSASIASHIAVDFSKNVGIPTMSFNDGMMLTALSNDEGFENAFARQIGFFADLGDVLFAISSSGNSQNIVNAVETGRAAGCHVITMSGFSPDNRLRRLGDYNLYVPSGEYGFVEIAHLALCHALADFAMGWTREDGLWTAGEGGASRKEMEAAR